MQNLYDKKQECFDLSGIWLKLLGAPEKGGAWLIWGREKNGKSWVSLLLANYMSELEKVLFISAEEGTGADFVRVCKRAKISPHNKQLHVVAFITLAELYKRLRGRNAPKIVFIDNVTTFRRELRNGALDKLLLDFPNVLFVFMAHERNGEPYTATAQLVKILAKVIIYVEGLAFTVGGRVPGGRGIIDEGQSSLIYGQDILNAV